MKDINLRPYVERELMLIQIPTSLTRIQILESVHFFRLKIVDLTETSFTIEATMDSGKISII